MKKTAISLLSIVLVFSMLFALSSCGSGYDGTYCLYDGDKCDMDTYLKLNGSTWSDETGDTGKCEISDGKITLLYTLNAERDANLILLGMGEDGETLELYSGTIENGKITIDRVLGSDEGVTAAVFYLDGKVTE